MANRLTTEILINLAGNLTAKARQYGANMSEFARTNQRAMSVVKATTAAAGRGLDALGNRYTTMIAGFASGAMLREFATTDRALTELGIAAGKTREEMRQIFSDTQDAAIKFRVDDAEVMKALANVNKMTGDLDFGVKNKEMMAASIAASGSDGDSIGGLFATFQKFKTKSDQENLLAMDFLNQLGKEGGFELKDFAQSGTKIFSAYAGTGRTGPEAIKEMGAVMESAMDAVGDRDLAATASFNLLNDLRNPKIAKILEASGVKLRDKSGGMLAINEIVKNIAQLSGKDGPKRQDERLAKAGFTDYSRLIISSVTTGKGAENFARYNAVVADGSGIMADAAYAAQDFTSAMTSLNVTWKKFANSNLAHPVQELADAINSVDQKTVQNWLETGKQIAIAVAGVIAARKAFQIGKGALDLFGVGKGKGIPKGVSDVFGSGVMPVYVVNMGSGGMGGGPDIGGPGGGKPPGRGGPGRAYSAMGSAWMAGPMAATIPFLDEKPNITDDDKASMVKWAQDRAKEPSVWSRVMDFLQPPAGYQDPSPWASMQPQNQPGYPFLQQPELKGSIEVSVKDDRVQVTSVKVNAPGVTMSAGTGLRSTEQD
ncbi:phage tail protein [Klebsiella pneumoniae]|uniref:phage tail protein n=1 Tax=Klebsiella pneumoniae TaxID=573 RepID=UPI0015E6A4F1|nr:phage tail protein [Klebsiella pneumoniae]MBA1372409.1 phage tail protein [Klebsiella pneumoniae]MBA1408637.1 phage tail protein [Klebsiella pneumoniae]MBV2036781.1 phage tail protein [Klebsiella pneumoniae]MBV2053511.1 phage tail protein [Klebsiella pneumoniae]MBV2064470.1 phage tail protein [Klebsiella pneumoniae]